MKIRDRLRQAFCRHRWKKIGFFEGLDGNHNVRYSIRRYECTKCGRVSHQDGRHDRLERKAAGWRPV